MICFNCGNKINPDSKYCSNCGIELGKNFRCVVKKNTYDIVCPNCGKSDKVQKVSSIVAEGFSTIQYDSILPIHLGKGNNLFIPIQKETYSSTVLANNLMPPSQPEEPVLFSFNKVIINCLLSFLLLMFIWNIIVKTLKWDYNEIQANVWLCFFIWIICFISFYYFTYKNYIKELTQYQREYPLWEQAKKNWSEYYYCRVCDGVFKLGGKFIGLDELNLNIHEDI